jgi:hypothetical protein
MSGKYASNPEGRLLMVFCKRHLHELVENEHYEDWFLVPDFSGFYCPAAAQESETSREPEIRGCDDSWVVCRRTDPTHQDIYELIQRS